MARFETGIVKTWEYEYDNNRKHAGAVRLDGKEKKESEVGIHNVMTSATERKSHTILAVMPVSAKVNSLSIMLRRIT